MKISLNVLKKYVKIPEKIDDAKLVRLIGARLVEVEEVVDLSEKYRGCVIVRVVKCEKIPETHLSLCEIDAGAGALVQVVCGAPNVHAGMLAVWIKPGFIVPSTYGGENFRLEAKKLRGFLSNGMLASLKELDLGDEHEGILEIEDNDTLVGRDFAEVFGLNDKILEIENKSLTHRPDTFGLIGFAREVAGILGVKFETPKEVFPINTKLFDEIEDSLIKIDIKRDEKICEKYTAVAVELRGAIPKASGGLTLRDVFLYKAGMRPISPLVDLTNYVMLMTGQPLHMFDLDKLMEVGDFKENEVKIEVRLARAGETLELIDGKVINLTETDIVIAAGEKVVALAGAMGGAETEVDANTRRILIEAASFSLYNLRKTQMKHGIFTEAITRFTKGVPVASSEPAMAFMLDKLSKVCYNDRLGIAKSGKDALKKTIAVNARFASALLGREFNVADICEILGRVEMECVVDGSMIVVTVPNWRTDLEIPEDIVEEVGRLYGYDNITPVLPRVLMDGSAENKLFALKKWVRDCLSYRLGANEILSYSFINEKLEEKFGILGENYKIVNSISPDLQIFRKSLVPSLTEKMYENWRLGYSDFALYEINQVANKRWGLTADGVPAVRERVGYVRFGDFYKIKADVLAFLRHLGAEYVLAPVESGQKDDFFEPKREMMIVHNEKEIGRFGEIRMGILKKMKITEVVSGFEIDLETLKESCGLQKIQMAGISKFPKVRRDITVKTPKNLTYEQILRAILAEKEPNISIEAEASSVYRGENAEEISYSFKLWILNSEKTMSGAEISDIMERMTARIVEIGAEV